MRGTILIILYANTVGKRYLMTVNELSNIQGIYKINFPNGKIYIGLSRHIRTRILNHLSKDYQEHPELPISRAINKYGIQSVDILEEVSGTREELIQKEKYWIQKYDATNPKIGYNISSGGDGAGTGWENQQAKLSETQLFELYDLLLHSKLTYEELGNKYHVTQATIARINAGTHYYQEGFDYPLRKVRVERYGLQNKFDAFYGREEELSSLIQELQDTNIPIKDLEVKYRIGSSTIAAINQGKKYHNEQYSYPLRKGGSSRVQTRIFTDEEMLLIKSLLEEGQVTMGDIGKQVKCDRKVISAINNGTRQHQDSWNYPLRKKKMKTGPKKP